jgi:tetratricopeptide (TPR) repeat protein
LIAAGSLQDIVPKVRTAVSHPFTEEEMAFNASLDAWDLLLSMGFSESSLYREANTIRLFCPIHKDQIRRSLIIYTDRNQYKCQYTNCSGHAGGNLLQFYAQYMSVDPGEVVERIRNHGTSETDLVERADKLIQQGNLPDALPLLQKAVQLDPRNGITRCRLAALYLELGDKEAGFQEYMIAAEHFGVQGELDKTLHIYSILVIISPDDVKVRKQMSYLFSRLKREDEAVAQLKWVVDKHMRKNELADAVSTCKKMVEMAPDYPDTHRILGELFLKQGDYFNAIEELKTAATHYIRVNNLKGAKDSVDLGIRFTPGNPALKDLRARINKALEMQAQAGETISADEKEYSQWLKELKTGVGLTDEQIAEGDRRAAQKSKDSPQPLTPNAPLPEISLEDPRIQHFRKSLLAHDPTQLDKVHADLMQMFNDVQPAQESGYLSPEECRVIRELYASFVKALESFRQDPIRK